MVTGIPTSGLVRIGDPLTLLPAGLAGHVRRMQVYGDDATEARAGECVALNLPEFDHEEVRRGMVLCASDAVAPVTMAEAELRILDSVKGKVEDFLEAHLHVGTASVLARVAMLEETEMAAGQKQMVQLRLAEPLAPGAGRPLCGPRQPARRRTRPAWPPSAAGAFSGSATCGCAGRNPGP